MRCPCQSLFSGVSKFHNFHNFHSTSGTVQLSRKGNSGIRCYSVVGSEKGSHNCKRSVNYFDKFRTTGVRWDSGGIELLPVTVGGVRRLEKKYYCSASAIRSELKGGSEQNVEETDEDESKLSEEYPSPSDEEYGDFVKGHNLGTFENEHMVKLTPLQRAIITVGSGLSAFLDPTRAENIATFGEISAGPVLRRLYQRMLEDPEGHRILSQKPRINSKSVDLDYLASLPEGTLGWAYVQFLKKNNVTPDSRLPVRFIEDPELAYVMQRYREVHDLVHTVTGQPTNMLGEVVVKWIEGIQTGLPMCVTGGLFGATRLRPKQRQRYVDTHLKWAIEVGFTSKPFLFIFYEERWEDRLDDLQFHICPKLLTPPPTKSVQRS